MPFFALYSGESQESEVIEEGVREVVRPDDGATVRRWSRSRIDRVNNLEHTEDRYEVILNGEVIGSEERSWSPATRGYSQDEVKDLYAAMGFTEIYLTSAFTMEPAKAEDTLFVAWGTRPAYHNPPVGNESTLTDHMSAGQYRSLYGATNTL